MLRRSPDWKILARAGSCCSETERRCAFDGDPCEDLTLRVGQHGRSPVGYPGVVQPPDRGDIYPAAPWAQRRDRSYQLTLCGHLVRHYAPSPARRCARTLSGAARERQETAMTM